MRFLTGNLQNKSQKHEHQILDSKSWRDNLPELLQENTQFRTPAFKELIGKIFDNSAAILTEVELNSLICECMIHGKSKTLEAILKQETPRTLRILGPDHSVDAAAWKTLLDATPTSSAIEELVLCNQTFDESGTNLFCECMRRMPRLESLHLNSCEMSAVIDDWPEPTNLQHLHVQAVAGMGAYALLLHMLETSSSLTMFHLSHCPEDMKDVAEHSFIAFRLKGHGQLRTLTLKELGLEREELESALGSYAHHGILAKPTLESLDLSFNPLTPKACEVLWKALQVQPRLSHLSLARCWPELLDLDWKELARLVSLKSLVRLDLSGNALPSSMAPVMMAIVGHAKMQLLDLNVPKASTSVVSDVLPLILAQNKTLISLTLPAWKDPVFGAFAQAMNNNHALRFLTVPVIEQRRIPMGERFYGAYPNYLALTGRVRLNWQHWHEDTSAFIEGGMRVVMSGLRSVESSSVPYDVARYAANLAIERIGKQDVINLHSVSKYAHVQGLEALATLRKIRAKSLEAQDRPQDGEE